MWEALLYILHATEQKQAGCAENALCEERLCPISPSGGVSRGAAAARRVATRCWRVRERF